MTTQKSNEFTGAFTACARRVEFRYWDFESELTDELRDRLMQGAEERAKECIIDGCHSGELNTVNIDNDEEIRGWWEIA